MRTRRNLIGIVGTVAAISIGGCLGDGSSASSDTSNTDNENEDSSQNNEAQENVLSMYSDAYDQHENGIENLENTLEALRNDNSEAESYMDTAEQAFRDAYTRYSMGPDMPDIAVEAFNVESEEDLPAVHHDATDALLTAIDAIAVELRHNMDGEAPVDEVANKLEEGEYSMPEVSEFEEALP